MSNEIKNGITITITVILVIAIVYVTTAVFMTGEIGNGKANSNSKTTTTNSSASKLYDNMIIASKTFDQNKDEYMVIFFYGNDVSNELDAVIKAYDSSNNKTKLYKVNVSDVINKFVLSEQQNSEATNYNELKINDITLITVKDKVITSYITKEENVINNLK